MRSKVKLCKFSVWKPFHSDLIQQQQKHTAAPRVRVNSLLLMCVVVLSYHLVFQIPLSLLSVSRFSKLIIFNLITENVHLSSPLRFSTHSLSSSLHHRPYFLVQIDCSREIECQRRVYIISGFSFRVSFTLILTWSLLQSHLSRCHFKFRKFCQTKL